MGLDRVQSIKLGFRYYYAGEPCPRGHWAPRSVQTDLCPECEVVPAFTERDLGAEELAAQEYQGEIDERNEADRDVISGEGSGARARNRRRIKELTAGIPMTTAERLRTEREVYRAARKLSDKR